LLRRSFIREKRQSDNRKEKIMNQAAKRPGRGKRIMLIVLAAVLLLLGGGLAAVNIMLASDDFQNRIKRMISEQAAEKAGLKVEIADKFSLSLFPRLSLGTGRLEVSRLPGRENQLPLRAMELAGADIQVGLWGLLGGRVDIKTVSLQDVRAIMDMPQGGSLHLNLRRTRISGISRSDGRAEIEGQLSWGRNKVEADINMGLFLDGGNFLEADFTRTRLRASLDGQPEIALALEGRLALAADLSQLQEFGQIQRISANGFKVTAAGLEASLEGDFSPAALSGKGRLSVQGSLGEALSWLGYRLASPRAGANLRLEATGESDGKVISLSILNASLDSVNLQSQASLTLPGPALINGALHMGRINLDDYQLTLIPSSVRPETGARAQSNPRENVDEKSARAEVPTQNALRNASRESGGESARPQQERAAVPAGAEAESAALPFNFLSFLRQATTGIALSGEEISLAGLKFTNIKGRIKSEQGIWRLEPLTLDCRGGRIDLAASADLNPKLPALRLNAKAAGIDLSSLAPGLKQGRLQSLRANLSAEGGGDILTSLNGALNFRLEKMDAALSLPAELAPVLPGQLQMDYASADFNIRQGIAGTANLLSEGSGLKAAGKGSLSLPRQSIDMRVLVSLPQEIKLLGSAGVPLIISGPLSRPEVSVDKAELAREAGRALIDSQITESLGGDAGRIRERVGGLLQGLGR
jgi:hypothetical protein